MARLLTAGSLHWLRRNVQLTATPSIMMKAVMLSVRAKSRHSWRAPSRLIFCTNGPKKSAEDFSPEFLKLIQRTTAECGADMVDRRFMHSCVVGCGQATQTCLETCECILENLRGPGNRTESTLRIIEQESQPSNPDTEPHMHEILSKCQSALMPDPSSNTTH